MDAWSAIRVEPELNRTSWTLQDFESYHYESWKKTYLDRVYNELKIHRVGI